ncbi:hypothetical protein [Klebsiella pneumoniae]|uniref:hypothetical protein n=1 Tax=Klebsiella pneumoniae TaxID=573 RepID=UPI000B9DE0BC|nr:hypothetical protein [Klebsiella pneumoniae]AWJ11140.1 hypothetical protein DEO52_17940 [Klebsiella pneumoniae]AWJ21028.1 hypothetical protein DEO55_10435 [Klebsiella pneumoniae]MBL1862526.1 hypothetical protein [Klebsiella pneumoniae]MBL2138729.1 hypothetical protein [Klebsiella pneumoniae]MBL2144373.1 hypothetical protein [Klebsiella pneumoniae]
MALILPISFRGLTVDQGVARVNLPAISSDKKTLSFGVRFFANSEEAEELYSEQYECIYDISGENPFSQAYEYLKTLDKFSGATDTGE